MDLGGIARNDNSIFCESCQALAPSTSFTKPQARTTTSSHLFVKSQTQPGGTFQPWICQ